MLGMAFRRPLRYLAPGLAAAFGISLGCGGEVAARPGPVAGAAPADLEVHGHRGARALFPENTVEGMVGAIELGADTVEMDVVLTADGVAVLHHEGHVNADLARDERGAWLAGEGPAIRSLTLAELQRYDVGRIRPDSDYAAAFPEQRPMDGVRIPTLRDTIAAAERASKGTVRYDIELKVSLERPEPAAAIAELADAVVAQVRELGVEPRTLLQSFDWRVLARIQEIAPGLQIGCLSKAATVQRWESGPSPWTTGLDVDELGGSVPRLAHARGCQVWSPDYRSLTAAQIAEAHALGLRVVPWTVNDPAHLRLLRHWGVDGIITDDPRLARRALQE